MADTKGVMKAVIYGAGNIGRGFIGQIFSESGYEVIFIDVAEDVVKALNNEHRYPVRILSDDDRHRDIWIEGVSAVDGRNEEEAAEAIACADIMATAVGVRVLPFIAPVIAKGVKRRFAGFIGMPNGVPDNGQKSGKIPGPLNIIICENLIDANKELERLIANHLGEDEKEFFNAHVGLVEASIGRMVPLQTEEMRDGNPLRICTEAYGFLPVDKAAFKGEIPSFAGMHPLSNFDFYIQRKLFIHNMGHAICAYLGMLRGDTYIYETARCSSILFIAQNAMMESALALSSRYGMPLAELQLHIRDLLRRFSNKALGDTCARVGADVKRKLGNRDRLIGALLLCGEEGVSPAFISAGISAAIYCLIREEGATQSREAARAVLRDVSSLIEDSALTEEVLSFHAILASILPPSALPGGDSGAVFEGLVQKIIGKQGFIGL